MKHLLTLLFSIITSTGIYAQTPQAEAFPLDEVQLSDGSRWRDNQKLDSAWICSFPVKRLLHSFQTTSGAWAALEGGYSGKNKIDKLGGWESLDCDLRGHAIGHLLSAYALMYANTGYDIFKLKGDSLVAGIRECQEVIGTGYVSAFPDGLLKRNLHGSSVWAPWYTIHKILSGLVLQYRLAGNETALTICKDFTRWADVFLSDDNLSGYTDDKATTIDAVRRRAVSNEFGGIGEAFYDIYALTNSDDALRCARFFFHNEKVDPLYKGNFDMGTQHCNTFLPKMAAELRSYTLGLPINSYAAEGRKYSNQLAMVDDFWHSIIHNHILAPGCLSDKEHFFDPKETSKHLTGNTGETCCTYNMLKLTRELYRFNPDDTEYFDYYERALYNHILGQQDPETGMVHYFLPTLTGAYKLYSTYDQSFWCCVGSSFESHAKYAESIYWRNVKENKVYINLFIPSTLNWKEQGVTINMDTDFPKSNIVRLTINADKAFTLAIRKPSWSGKAGYKTYNIKPGSQKIEYRLKMSLRTEAAPDDPSRIALFYGPVLLAGQLGTEGVSEGNNVTGGGFFSDPKQHNDYYGYDYKVPESIKSINLNIKNLKRTGALEWQTAEGIKVKPLYDTHRQRYVVYWN